MNLDKQNMKPEHMHNGMLFHFHSLPPFDIHSLPPFRYSLNDMFDSIQNPK
jgi:hypothetical protein